MLLRASQSVERVSPDSTGREPALLSPWKQGWHCRMPTRTPGVPGTAHHCCQTRRNKDAGEIEIKPHVELADSPQAQQMKIHPLPSFPELRALGSHTGHTHHPCRTASPSLMLLSCVKAEQKDPESHSGCCGLLPVPAWRCQNQPCTWAW